MKGTLMGKNTRLNTLDIAKGIGIIFVVFAHVNYTPSLLVLIYSFHMPLFFILAGMVFNREKYPTFKDFIKRRWKTMIIPYLIFSALSMIYVFVSEKMFEAAVDLSMEQYIDYFIQIFLAQGSKGVLDVPLWFVPCLLLVEIMYYFISKYNRKIVVVAVAVLTTTGWILESGLLDFDNTILPWSLDSALFALSFYATGNIFSKPVITAIKNIKKDESKAKICVVIICVMAVIWLPTTLINGKITLGSKILNNGFLLYLTGVTGTLIVLAISILLEKCKALIWLGRNTFCIMSVHYIYRKYTVPVIYEALNMEMYDREILSETLLPFAIVFAMSIISVCLYNIIKNMLMTRNTDEGTLVEALKVIKD